MTYMLLSTSCKKHNCECKAYNLNNPEPSGHTNYVIKGSKSHQKQLCTDMSTQPDNYGNYTTCGLK